MAAGGETTMSELGLSEVLLRLDRLATAVQENGDRVSDRVMDLDRKLDDLGQTTARLEGTVTNHISTEEMWRTEVSGRFQLVEFNADKKIADAEKRIAAEADAAKKLAAEAKEKADASGVKRDVWRAQVSAVVAILGLVGTLVAIATKLPECNHHKSPAAVQTVRP